MKDIKQMAVLGAGATCATGRQLPMGPLTLIDLIGLDVHLAKTRYSSNGGLLGRKTGRGFFSYND